MKELSKFSKLRLDIDDHDQEQIQKMKDKLSSIKQADIKKKIMDEGGLGNIMIK